MLIKGPRIRGRIWGSRPEEINKD